MKKKTRGWGWIEKESKCNSYPWYQLTNPRQTIGFIVETPFTHLGEKIPSSKKVP